VSAPPSVSVAIGERFGRGTVTELGLRVYRKDGTHRRAARLRCDCGSTYVVILSDLRRKHMTSCGCAKMERARTLNRTHGLSTHPLYSIWDNMIRRCEWPNMPQYPRYGGRGITVCERWHDLQAFIDDILAELGPRPDGMTFDRIDNDGNYEPGNVRWATQSQQNANSGARDGTAPQEWRARRRQVRELYEQGVTSPARIAGLLVLPRATVSNDVAWIKKGIET
jgi:hypothetical protein